MSTMEIARSPEVARTPTPGSDDSGSVYLNLYGVNTAASPSAGGEQQASGFSQDDAGMSEEGRFQLEMQHIELEAQKEIELCKLDAEERDINSAHDLEKMRIEATTPHAFSRGDGGDLTVEGQIVRSLNLITDFDDNKVTEWFRRFEKMAAEFSWPQEWWVGLVANKLTGKALEVYDRMAVKDLAD